MPQKKNILSGMRPTGKLHIGHLLGALQNWKKLQDEYFCYYMVANWHALDTEYAATGTFAENTYEMLFDWLACGLDPEKSVMFLQSHVPQHAELHVLLSAFVPLSWVERCPTYKQQLIELKDRDINTYGFLGYPVLQAADILVYKADAVPVGEDQLPHLELTRDIARRFNGFFGNIFPEPQPLLTQTPRIPGIDGRKMSKSYNNAIFLGDTPETIEQKIRQMITDPARIHPTDCGHPDVCSVFAFHNLVNADNIQDIRQQCIKGTRGCVDCKKLLKDALAPILAPIREKREYWKKHSAEVREILLCGRNRALERARSTMEEVNSAMGLDIS